MDNNELLEFDLDAILEEFHDVSDEPVVELAEEEDPLQMDVPDMELSQDTLARLDALTAEETEEAAESEDFIAENTEFVFTPDDSEQI